MAEQGQPSTGSVLIVEDEALVAFFLADLVDDLGWTVIGPAASRAAALQAAAAKAASASLMS